MADFTLDSSVLSGAQYTTTWTTLDGEFREIQFRASQTVSSQDMEYHFLEFHFEIAGVSEE